MFSVLRYRGRKTAANLMCRLDTGVSEADAMSGSVWSPLGLVAGERYRRGGASVRQYNPPQHLCRLRFITAQSILRL